LTNNEYKEEVKKIEKLSNISNTFNYTVDNGVNSISSMETISNDLGEMYENEGIENLKDFKKKQETVANKLDKLYNDEDLPDKIDRLDKRKGIKKTIDSNTSHTIIKSAIRSVLTNAALGSSLILAYFTKAFSFVLSKAQYVIRYFIKFLKNIPQNPKILMKYIAIAVIAWFLFKLFKKPVKYLFYKIKTEKQLTDTEIQEAFSLNTLKLHIREINETPTLKEKTTKKIEEIKEGISLLSDMVNQLNVLRIGSLLLLFSFLFGLYKMTYWIMIGVCLYAVSGIFKDYYDYIKKSNTNSQIQTNPT
jgi:hypothetical protein